MPTDGGPRVIEARLSLLLQLAILVVLVVVAMRLSNLDIPVADTSGVETRLDTISKQLDGVSQDLSSDNAVLLAICATEQNGGHFVVSVPASHQCSLGK